MKRLNDLNYGKNCIGQYVVNKYNERAIISDMYTVDGSKCVVKLIYHDGIEQIRQKYHVSYGLFKKPIKFNLKDYFNNGFKMIKRYPNYIVNNKAEIFYIGKGRYYGNKKKHTKNITGYMYVTIKKPVFVHRIMAETFIQENIEGLQVNHIDGNKTNNILCNLELVSRKENNKKYLDFESMGISNNLKIRIQKYCLEKDINLKQYIAYCIKEVSNAALAL